MITSGELNVLEATLDFRVTTVDDITAHTGYSRGHVYRLVDSLEEKRLIEEENESTNRRLVTPLPVATVESYRELRVRHSHVDWPSLLTPALLRSTALLNEPRRVSTIAERLDISRQAAHNTLRTLGDRAMLSGGGPKYAIREDMKELWHFACDAVVHEHRLRARSLSPSATIRWGDPLRAVVNVHTGTDADALDAHSNWSVTGLAGFREYGLTYYLPGQPTFWYGPDHPAPLEELVCHALLVDQGIRRTGACMLLIESESIQRENLMEEAEWYNLTQEIEAIYGAIEDGEFGNFGQNFLPSSNEYDDWKTQYGVD